MAIAKGYKANFETLLKAMSNGDALLMECKDAKTGKPVFVVCACYHDAKTEEIVTVPLAKLFDGNPYEELTPPEIEATT
jgi:hypothetical protein